MIARKDAQEGAIRIRGLRQNNLRSVDCDLPLGRFIAVTGVSGSGKSSFAFDALYGEGQRRYIETFSSYTRQFLDRMARPDADAIENIPPAIAIDQSGAIKTSRSTVGTLTGINDYLKLLFARASTGFCPQCGRAVEPEGTSAVLAFLAGLPPEAFPALITALVPLGGFDSSEAIARALAAQGFLRFLRGGDVVRIEDLGLTDVQSPALEVVVDRIASPHATRSRRADSLELAFRAGKGAVAVRAGGASRTFTSDLRCGDCGTRLAAPTPGLFSFNNPYGACTRCRGFGRIIEIDPRRVVPDPSLTIAEGAIKPFTGASARHIWRRCLRFCAEQKIPVDVPYERLSDPQRKLVQEGGPGFGGVKAFFRHLEERKYKLHVRVFLSRYRGYETCPDCLGGRLRPEAFYFRLAGKTIREVWDASIRDLRRFIAEVESSELPKPVRLVAGEVASRLGYLDSVGLGYLTLGRQARTLSGGEVERVNLTSALGASLVNTLFVLDEPSIGLHARDNARLIEILREVSSRGNTVVVVEHDPEILQAVEHVIDIGPEAGAAGGRIVAEGTLEAVAASSESITGAYLAGRKCIPRRTARRAPKSGRSIRVRGARENNLQRLDVDLPLDVFVVVSGVSGSGKSTLIEDVVWRAYRRRAGEAVDGDVNADRVDGFDLVSAAVLVDQSPLGRTPRGNTATYMKVFEAIRKLFGASSGARQAGLTARDFSFNAEGGRCPECGGAGATQIEMQFLSDVTLPCESCGGKRFQERVLQVRLRGKSIDDVLSLTVREAMDFFAAEPDLLEKLSFLDALGLGYLRLGQPLNTLSGGEAQRLKLASRVQASRRERLLFLLDEPTTGLHLDDVGKLLEVLHGLVDAGHSVVVIEHHLDVIVAADWVVDLGPEGGAEGGRRLDAGTPEDVAARCASTGSITGAWLQKHLDAGSPGRPRPSQTSKRPGIARPAALDSGAVRVVGARENNLKDITVSIPRDQLVVVTGLSGAGKSSLLHDIVFAEGQRRYLDCMSPYARQFVEELRRPDIDHLEGIPPAVAIEQRTTVGGRKSTVGTVTEVYQFLRLLYARGGVQFCPECDVEVAPRKEADIVEEVHRLASRGGRLLAPAIRGKKGFHSRVLLQARRNGVLDARIDGDWVAIPADREIRLDRHRAHDIDLVLRRFRSGGSATADLRTSVALGLEMGRGVVRFLSDAGKETVLSLHRSCPSCGRDFEEPDPRNFSFHSWHGACEACNGYGSVFEVDPEKLIDRWDVPAEARPDGPLAFLEESPFGRRDRKRFLQAAAAAVAAPWEEPLSSWPRRALKILIEGDAARGFPGLRGFVGAALEGLEEDDRELHWARWGIEKPCELCGGGRLQREWLSVRVASRGIAELTRLPIAELRTVAQGLELSARARAVCGPVLEGILSRLEFLEQVGLGYLTLDRAASTLSTGESQRIRLAAQLGSSLRGVAYILDEPTIGLHPRDGARLLEILRRLRDAGNSVFVVEHDEDTIQGADHVIDMGPGPGRHGGEVVAQGSFEDVLACERSATGAYFRERRRESSTTEASSAVPELDPCRAIVVEGARRNNLRNVTASFPLGALTVVTGVSGAGKSTLVREVLEESVRRRLRGLRTAVGCRALRGAELVEAVREVDQLPIGRTPRSTPATYVGLWNRIRSIYAATSEARARGFDVRRFSFNAPGGRCETCAGQGRIRMEMSFLPDVSVGCEACQGGRFNAETLEITYRGRNIAEMLQATVEEALEVFSAYPDLTRQLRALDALGLGYLTLGQASTTLSGGEAQRVKLAVELAKTTQGVCLYLLDEPTTGLHLRDVERLVAVLRQLAAAGHAVVVIEHHLDVVQGANWVIDLGPEAGAEGGRVLYEGPPAGLRDAPESWTGRCLRERGGARAALRRALPR